MIALLKILLATAPTTKSKSESVNVLIDVLAEETPSSVLESMQLGIDVNRHKVLKLIVMFASSSANYLQEIVMKAVTALLLLMLKHFKLNHVYQVYLLNKYEYNVSYKETFVLV
jgi:hypothetical protein